MIHVVGKTVTLHNSDAYPNVSKLKMASILHNPIHFLNPVPNGSIREMSLDASLNKDMLMFLSNKWQKLDLMVCASEETLAYFFAHTIKYTSIHPIGSFPYCDVKNLFIKCAGSIHLDILFVNPLEVLK
jgi:hypothetical protein